MRARFALGAAVILFIVFLVGCDVDGRPAAVPPPPPGLSCSATLPPAIEVAPEDPVSTERASPVAGQMTEEAVHAKRLFDAERWPQAAEALARVANAQTSDDEGNRELAQYHLAISLYRMKLEIDAARIFVRIAARPRHLKFNETVLWLMKMVDAQPALVHAMRLYGPESIAKFDNANQRELYWKASFVAGRERFERQDRESIRFFEAVSRESPFYPDARECMSRAKHGS